MSVRAMRDNDVTAVLDIQSRCYDEAKLESRQSFLAKLNAAPATCFIACVADAPVAYLVAVPAVNGRPPPLNGMTYLVPRAANALYLHDLAVHPAARGSGAASALVEAYFHALKASKAQFGGLTAVNDSWTYWERHGFRSAALAEAPSGHRASYGDGARYMSLRASV